MTTLATSKRTSNVALFSQGTVAVLPSVDGVAKKVLLRSCHVETLCIESPSRKT